MENKPKQIQQMSPLMPNSGQIRELRITMGKEKAAEWLEKIISETIERYHLEKALSPGQRLRQLMGHRGFSQEELTAKSGISATSISKYVTRPFTMPKKRVQEAIASALGVHRNEIWGDGESEAERRS